jgi:hypothetical protein
MAIPTVAWILGGVTILGLVMIFELLVRRSRRVSFTDSESPDQKPDWIETTPPAQTIAATQADGEGIQLYDQDPGEQVAAPFAEQIEDILQARLRSDPVLATTHVDLGTAPGGDLEIWVDGERYTDVSQIPNERLRQAFREAIEQWEHMQE